MRNSRTTFRLEEMFEDLPDSMFDEIISERGCRRSTVLREGARVIRDKFLDSKESCSFIRWFSECDEIIQIKVTGEIRVEPCPAGGWLLIEGRQQGENYWIPQMPLLRSIDCHGKIFHEKSAEIIGFEGNKDGWSVELNVPSRVSLDFLAWKISTDDGVLLHDLRELVALESQPIFMWGSHSIYKRPVDLYLHLIFGHVYENRFAWPYNSKICSENDAHALYVTLSGLQRATGKRLYALLKEQLLLSVLARQSSDGGWHHGEWTDDMEAHLRLNGSAIHLLLDLLDERDDPAVKQALERGVSFVSRHRDESEIGTWLLHDSLELSVEGMNKSPFKWVRSRVLGKSPSNMLVLNTHLDSLVLLGRYRRVTCDGRCDELIESAKSATRTVLNLRPLEILYQLIFSLIRLNLLPTQVQMNLPMPLRVVKRLVGKWLSPNFFQVTARFPRLVMPGGYIERAIALKGMADSYHSINVMDLARYTRCYPRENLGTLIDDAVAFVEINDILTHWADKQGSKYAVGFWAEALYHLYLLAPNRERLSKLADVIFKLEEIGIGLPPSFLGANAEAVSPSNQIGCSSPTDRKLRVANLSRKDCAELLIVNATTVPRRVSWESPVPCQLRWETRSGEPIQSENEIEIPGHSWIVGLEQRIK